MSAAVTDASVLYSARVLEGVETRPGCWKTLRVGVFHGEERVGEYARNHHTLMDTFCPFKRDDQWFALYSTDYTATSVMRLPDCKRVGGEKPDSAGFCPVEFYVPAYRTHSFVSDHNGETLTCSLTDSEVADIWSLTEEEAEGCEWGEVRYLPFGFVSGCVWGDDSSWKVQAIDLRNPRKPRRMDAFGYVELPRHLSLRKAVNIHDIEGDFAHFEIAVSMGVHFHGDDFSFRAFKP